MLLKLNKVPKCPGVMELAGRVAYLDDRDGLSIGIEFDELRGDYASAIRSLVSSRSGVIPTGVPPKARRKAVAQEESLLAETRERVVRPVVSKPPVPEPPPPEPREPAAPKTAAPPPEEEPSPAPEVAPPRNPALLRLKKRARGIVILANPAYGQRLRNFLLEDGYGRVFLAIDQEELSDHIRQPNVGLVFIDTEMSMLDCLEMVTQLREEDQDLPPMIVAAEEVSRSLVLAAHRAGISQLVVKPYDLDETLAGLLEQVMRL
jgi:CheY-like chemotaxis protein